MESRDVSRNPAIIGDSGDVRDGSPVEEPARPDFG